MKKYIPNFFTFLNLTCGCIAVLLLSKDNYNASVIFCLLAFLFDFAERCIGPKVENNDSAGRSDGHSRKNIFFSRKTDWDPEFAPGRKIEMGP